eukprot:TRINITY_DN7426_c0_g1_i2.p1 TRINITY_DN7426_c0_g1~~TRINITY_DN7426_c0_g1_i2.p1  ORF type:complete len:1955 (+),score=443.63 TRINITY_DN7426_c0_g1_i2:345-5867(+)
MPSGKRSDCGERLVYGDDRFVELEEIGLKEARWAVFVLVACDLGVDVGFSGPKVSLPSSAVTGWCLLELYCRFILAIQGNAAETQESGEQLAGQDIPLVIITSKDTHARTEQLLVDHSFFGLSDKQVHVVMQTEVPVIADREGKFGQDPADPVLIETKPPGSGSVHTLLFTSGLAKRFSNAGRKWVVISQGTNSLLFRAVFAALGVSSRSSLAMNTLAVPRMAKDTMSAIVTLTCEDGRNLTISLESGQLEQMLTAFDSREDGQDTNAAASATRSAPVVARSVDKGTNAAASDTEPAPELAPVVAGYVGEGDVADATGFSPFPGSTATFICSMETYMATLSRTSGIVAEFVDPTYAVREETDKFKESVSLESRAEDFSRELSADAVVGYTLLDSWCSYSPVKFGTVEAQRRSVDRLPPQSGMTGVTDVYAANCRILRMAGAEIEPAKPMQLNGINVDLEARVVWSPAWALTHKAVKGRLAQGLVLKISQRSTLILDGDIVIEELVLDGALILRAAPGCKVRIGKLTVSNAGWEVESTANDTVDEGIDEVTKLRGFRFRKVATEEKVFDVAGTYHIDEDGFALGERRLARLGQAHLLDGLDDEGRRRLAEQVDRLDADYPGTLEAYVANARRLLEASRCCNNPFEGCTPSIPTGERLTYGDERFLKLEDVGLKEASSAAFVVVAGGLGERLGFSGIKVAMPVTVVTGVCFLELYCQHILQIQAQQPAGTELKGAGDIPLVIMTSSDTHARTIDLLESQSYFGLKAEQVHVVMQKKVPCLASNNAALARDAKDPVLIETKPHGHGDVHSLLHSSGLARRFKDDGRKWLIFFQDTSSLFFRVVFAALGVSVESGFAMNSLTAPRKAKDAMGAIAKLTRKDGTSLTINVEYNQLDPLLKNTVSKNGDVADKATGFSPFPGNTNMLIFNLESYLPTLERTSGIIAEFVNPKYADAERTKFKSSTRLECMMQDFPAELPPEEKVGFTMFDTWCSYSPVKNSAEAARQKFKDGTHPQSGVTGETDLFAANCRILRMAGAEIEAAKEVELNGIKVDLEARVVWSPNWATGYDAVCKRLTGQAHGGHVKISQRSTLILEGDIMIEELHLDGALVVKAAPGCQVRIAKLTVTNDGWELDSLDKAKDGAEGEETIDEVASIRGFRLRKLATEEKIFEEPGEYIIDEDGFGADHRQLLRVNNRIGQMHLFDDLDHASRDRLLAQMRHLETVYPGGLEAYVLNARKLLEASRLGDNPFADYTPSVPAGQRLEYGDSRFDKLEEMGLREARASAFVLVAGGLGERLGFSGIKVAMPYTVLTGWCFLELYCRYILAIQAQQKPKDDIEGTGDIPLVIMTSGDTHERTMELLESRSYFGLKAEQVHVVMQEKVPCLSDGNATLAKDPKDPVLIETKPHGHGDVHSLLHSSGLAKRFKEEGRKWLVFFQDTSSLFFRVVFAALGVSLETGFAMNSITAPRRAKDAMGAIAKLTHKNGKSLTINVEYNQLDPLLRSTPKSNGDVADQTGFSPYPGNTNMLIFSLDSYLPTLERTSGIIAEFVNPKYADADRTKFKSSTRLECMMQDFPKELPADANVGFTMFDTWCSYSPVKNSAATARQKFKEGTHPQSGTTGETDLFAANCRIFRMAGAHVEPAKRAEFNGIDVDLEARIVWSPSWAISHWDVHLRLVVGLAVSITQRSTLILEGDITIEELDLDGALVIRAAPGCKVRLAKLTVKNAGWELQAPKEVVEAGGSKDSGSAARQTEDRRGEDPCETEDGATAVQASEEKTDNGEACGAEVQETVDADRTVDEKRRQEEAVMNAQEMELASIRGFRVIKHATEERIFTEAGEYVINED